MNFLTLIFTIGFIFSGLVHAETATINSAGGISISGVVDNVSTDSFTIIYNDETIEVAIDAIDEETLDQLIDTNIIKSGSYVTVTGRMEDGLIEPVVKADAISLYAQ